MPDFELTKEQAVQIAWSECNPDEFKLEEEVFEETTRWEILYSRVFQHVPSGKYYQVFYRKGATEYQESEPFEYEDEPIKAQEVRKVVKHVVVWEVVND